MNLEGESEKVVVDTYSNEGELNFDKKEEDPQHQEDVVEQMEKKAEELSEEKIEEIVLRLFAESKSKKEMVMELGKNTSFAEKVGVALGVGSGRQTNLYWNERFQELMEAETIDFDRLTNLGNDFVHTATKYGKIIISELFLPYHEKTIKPMSVGGGFISLFNFFASNLSSKFCLANLEKKSCWRTQIFCTRFVIPESLSFFFSFSFSEIEHQKKLKRNLLQTCNGH